MEHHDDFLGNLKFLLISALYSWKKIIAIALVLGVVIGGVQAYSKWQNRTTADSAATQLTAEEQSQLNEKLFWTEQAEQNYQRQLEYMDNSILMHINYRETYKASATYYVDTNYQIQPGSTYQDTDHTKILVSLYET